MLNEPIHTIMTRDLHTLSPQDSLGQVRDLMLKHHIHHVPIVEGRSLVGIISSWDLFKMGKSAEEYSQIKAAELMTRRVATLSPDDHLGAAAEVLREHLFHAIPIVGEENKELLGIITSTDLIRLEFTREYPDDLSPFVKDNM
ncbi:MAG TPA: CBS domain-containing protein [Saprospiraceae bacterium]|nr:CBS domain-containing protein [Saprospiraceae bacterium]HND89357.1 CBS domain-containing protein [Saprospiraceae bacterium]HNG90171.1 CBS domain-containing protein [Saprospiraceae bacterium]